MSVVGNHVAETWCIGANTSCMHMLMMFVLSELSDCQLAMQDECHLQHGLASRIFLHALCCCSSRLELMHAAVSSRDHDVPFLRD